MDKVLQQLEQQKDLPLNSHIAADGKHGIGLYRANFHPTFNPTTSAFCCLSGAGDCAEKRQFCASPELIDEMPKWAENFQHVEIDANHWAMLSQAELVAEYLKKFALKNN